MFENLLFKISQDLPNNLAQKFLIHHINILPVLPHNHLFGIKTLFQDKDLFHLTIDIVETKLLTINLDISIQNFYYRFS